MAAPRIEIPQDKIEAFCRKWKVKELSLFGSVLTNEFRPDSDVDFLVVFQERPKWSLFEGPDPEEELSKIVGRKVDLVQKHLVQNPFRRHHILTHREVIYRAT